MGHYVHLHVAFNCGSSEEQLAKAAAQHLASLPVNDAGYPANLEAGWYLKFLSGGQGIYPGPKGTLSIWGVVGNYTLGDEFVEALRPFFREVLKEVIAPHRHICVFYEPEQSERCTVFEIFLEELPEGERFGDLVVKRHEDMPFAFMQM